MNLKQTRNRLPDIENRLWLPRAKKCREGWTGGLGLAHASYYVYYSMDEQ